MLQELEPTVDAARLRKCVEEFAHLSRSDVVLEQFFRRFISALVPAIRGRGMAVWFFNGPEMHIAAGAGVEETDYQNDPRQKAAINAAVREAAESKQPLVIGPGNAEGVQPNGKQLNFKPFPFLYVPIVTGEGTSEVTLLAVMQLWMPTGFDPRRYNEALSFMHSMGREAAVLLRTKRVESLAVNQARLQRMVQFVTEISGQYDIKRLGTVLVNWARDLTGCDRCAFFAATPDGKLMPTAVSNVEVVNPKSALVQLQMKLSQEALDALEVTLFQKSEPKREMQGDISDYFVLSHATDALAIPIFQGDKQKLGVLLIESHRDRALDKETQSAAVMVANRAMKAVAAAQEIERLPFLGLMRRLARLRARLTASTPRKLFFKYGIPLLLALCVALFPLRMMVHCDCIVVPKVRGVAVAEVSGRIKQIFVKEGDTVAADQPIAKIDDEDLQENLRLSQEEEQRYEIEGNRAEAVGDQAARQIALVEASTAARQVDLFKLQIARTVIRSPINGIVLTKDIDTLTGSLIAAGTKFCEFGDFHRWQLINKVPESEVGILETKLRNGPLKMQFVLNSAPGRDIDAVIPDEQAISPMSSAVPGANVFMVRADFQEQPAQLLALKAGYSGRGKIPLDRRPLLYLALRKFINYLRVRWFF
ncbi:MAG TPA: GAF domain-containing protein [Chthoniobacteraceae bacterium]|jgi:hypothetical protein|nr:GAF domain-containing protein [Chthoniobacteraceae bacterium]